MSPMSPNAPTRLLSRFATLLSATALALLASAAPTALAENRTFALPTSQADPGSTIDVPLSLDNANGLAALSIQVNFDPTQLELLSVAQGSLGAQFSLSEGRDDGLVKIMLARSQNLTAASGSLATLKFKVKSDLPVGNFTELAIANDRFRARVDGVIYGAILSSITPTNNETYEVTLTLDGAVVNDIRTLYLEQTLAREAR